MNIYIVELRPEIWGYRPFFEANCDVAVQKQLVYVASTDQAPVDQYRSDKSEVRGRGIVKRFGLRIRFDLIHRFPLANDTDPKKAIASLAVLLRERGYGVWIK